MKFWIKMVSGLILGIVVGGYLGPDSIFLEPFRIAGLLFIRVLGFLVLPLLLVTAARSVVRLRGSRRLFILFVKSMGWFVLLTAVGAGMGMALGEVLKPGVGINIREFESPAGITYPGTSAYILGIVPENVLELLRSGYGVLAALFVAFLLGTGILLAERHADPFAGILESLDHVLHRLNRIVLEFLPIGVFLYIGYFMGFMTASTLLPYLKLILIVAAGAFIQIFIVQALLVYLITKKNPFTFMLGVLPALIVGYVSGNRYTSYPALAECVEHNLGADREVFTFTAGLGTAFSLPGSATAAGVSTLFVAQAYGLDLSVYLQIIIVFLITASSLKLDGRMEGGLVLLSVVLAHIIKLPAEGYALIMSVSIILFQIETVVNVAGNAAVSYMMACSEGAVKHVRVRDYM